MIFFNWTAYLLHSNLFTWELSRCLEHSLRGRSKMNHHKERLSAGWWTRPKSLGFSTNKERVYTSANEDHNYNILPHYHSGGKESQIGMSVLCKCYLSHTAVQVETRILQKDDRNNLSPSLSRRESYNHKGTIISEEQF